MSSKKRKVLGQKDMHDLDFVNSYQQYLDDYHKNDLQDILCAENGDDRYFISIDLADLLQASDQLVHSLFKNPLHQLRLFDQAAARAQQAISEACEERKTMSVKPVVRIRLSVEGSPLDCPGIGHIRVKHVGQLLMVSGTVSRCGAMKLFQGERIYECANCKYRFLVYAGLELGNSTPIPSSCPSGRNRRCKGVTFQLVEKSIICHDYQEIRIQENMETLVVGSIPRSITVALEDDLVDTVVAGGFVCSQEHKSTEKSNDVRPTNYLSSQIIQEFEGFWKQFKEAPLEGRNIILQQICPQVYGRASAKLAVALTLIGGVQHIDASGSRVRGESHLLLVGDPGTGKSQFLKYAAKLSTRAVMTSGVGSSSAGLSVTAMKDRGEWMLEAGALVLADGGLCCIDEFESMRESDRATIHEAMEQQTISVAKAGLITTVSTRTTIFGVTNIKGTYDPYRPLTENTSFSSPLLSRFDMVLALLDTKNAEWDNTVSSHILHEHCPDKIKRGGTTWTLAALRSYIEYVKEMFQPRLTKESEKVLVTYYQLQRRNGQERAGRTTLRMLQSLIRLAQAHARLMFRQQVLEVDAVAAVACVELSMTSCSLFDGAPLTMNAFFTNTPDEDYLKDRHLVLSQLQLA